MARLPPDCRNRFHLDATEVRFTAKAPPKSRDAKDAISIILGTRGKTNWHTRRQGERSATEHQKSRGKNGPPWRRIPYPRILNAFCASASLRKLGWRLNAGYPFRQPANRRGGQGLPSTPGASSMPARPYTGSAATERRPPCRRRARPRARRSGRPWPPLAGSRNAYNASF